MRIRSFDKIVLSIIAAALALTALIVWRGGQAGVQIVRTYPADGGETGPWGRVGIQFKQPMQTGTVESRFSLEPKVPGHFEWQGSTLWYVFDQMLAQDTPYRFKLRAGAQSQDNRPVTAPVVIQFHARPPAVVYLSTQPGQTELWRMGLDGGAAQPLTATGGKVYDYAVSRDGEGIAYSVSNARGGVDLWLMDRAGAHSRLLVDCGPGRCSLPAWAPGGKQIAYHRDALNSTEDPNISGVWVVDAASGQTDYLIAGAGAVWSPDGASLAIPDPKANTVRLLNLQTGKGLELQGSVDFFPAWSPDSTRLIYAELQTKPDSLPYLLLDQLDLRTNQVTPFLRAEADTLEYGIPAIAPDGQSLVVGLRVQDGGPTRQLWWMNSDGSHKQAITQQERFTNASYSWDPSGSMVLFQQSDLGVSHPSPHILVWERAIGAVRTLANGALPAWLP